MSDNRIAQVEIIIFKIMKGEPLFLLLRRISTRGGFWQPVTGGVKAGEDFTLAAKREMMEETGIEELVDFLEDIHFFEFESVGFGHMKEYVYGAHVPEEAQVVLSSEHDQMKWCSLEEALNLLKYESNRAGFRKIDERIKSFKK